MITVLYTYFGQKERIPGIIEQGLKTIIVDDCSKEPLGPINGVEVLRIIDDIKWNQPGARNLGFHIADGWVLCADIDHLVTKDNIEDLMKLDLQRGIVYYIGREDTHSVNVYLIHKDDFEKVGGYDEDFSGNYGYDDIHFYEKCKRFLKVIELPQIKVKVFAKESSSIGVRDTKHNLELIRNKGFEETKRLRFNWKYVK
jgi:hypothetical protein